MPNINEAFPSKYLKAGVDITEPTLAKMKKTEWETLGNERKLVLYFEDLVKGLVLNKTNANTIGKIYGDETDDWSGQEIVLFETTADLKGESVPAIRLRAPKKKAAAKAPAREVVDDEIPF